MKSRQRLLAAIKGDEFDHLPWAPNLGYWWGQQGGQIEKQGEVEFIKSVGADPLLRGHYNTYGRKKEQILLFKTKYENTEIRRVKKGNKICIYYDTPFGILKFVRGYSANADRWYLEEHGVKTAEDFKILKYIKEDMIIEPFYQKFNSEKAKYIDDALLVPLLTPDFKTDFQSLVEYWVGTEQLVYALMDYPEVVEDTLATMWEVSRKCVEFSAASDAKVFTTFEDTSTTNISPSYYEQYILPQLNDWCDILHKNDKLYLQHACGHLKNLMPFMAGSGIDGIESISPPPTGNIELWQARQLLPDDKVLIGGIEPTIFSKSTPEKLKKYILKLIDRMKGSRFVLANSDSCPPDVAIEKFKLISDIVKNKGD